MKYDVTVGIVNYNDFARTCEAVRSILEQTKGVKIKIYVIDNASTDGSAERIAGEFANISVVFSDRNLGYGVANNLIIGKLDSTYHAIVNPDIIIKSDVFKEMFDFMQKNQDIGLCSPSVYFVNGSPQYLPKRDPKFKYLVANRLPFKNLEGLRKEYRMLDEDLSNITDIQFATGCFMFLRTDLFKGVGGFDERYFLYFEDADLSREIRKHARVVYTPQIKVYHDYRRSSAKKMKYFLIHVSSMFRYFIKWRKQEKLNVE